jgi:hypothetical protein
VDRLRAAVRIQTPRSPKNDIITAGSRMCHYKRPRTGRDCTTRLWQNRFWTCGWRAPGQRERVLPDYRTHRNDHGQTSLTVPPPQRPRSCRTRGRGCTTDS